MKLRHSQAVLLMVLVAFLWSTAGVVTRHLEFARKFEVTFWRSLFASISLMLILPYFQGRAVFRKIRDAGVALWLSGVCWAVMFTAYMVAFTLTSVGNVLVILAVGPLLTAIAARIFIGYRVPLRTWVAILVAGAGIAYMFASQVGSASIVGSLVALTIPIAAAVNWTISQHSHDQGHDLDLVPAVMLGAFLSTASTCVLAFPLQASMHDVVLLGTLGVFQLAVPCVLCMVCARVLSAPEISLLQLLEVIFGILLVWVGANEAPSTSVLTGGVLVIGALVANEWLGWRRRVPIS
ncbi:DMT family transporter [Rhodoferax sp. GW822-FHT02A01]|uniref:DMT family transporter n=1 Tax=Rhodoferax sp. GW822-FHT02A01 TaxID=3141537 RepID=UPI00315CC9ED